MYDWWLVRLRFILLLVLVLQRRIEVSLPTALFTRLADLADLELVSEGAHLPAHSQYVAFHSHFIQRLIHDLGPTSWKEPLVIDSALQGHSRAAVNMLLAAVYRQGKVKLSTAQQAWQMYKLADHLDCPSMLQQCREYINSSSGQSCSHHLQLHWNGLSLLMSWAGKG